MKAKRRHELETNELALWLGRVAERYRGILPHVAVVALVIVVTLIAVSVWAGRSTHTHLAAWAALYQARDTKDLEKVASQYADTDVALWAQLELADYYCNRAQRLLQSDRPKALKSLRRAQQLYQAVLNSAESTALMRRRAALPEAMCWEMMGERQKAIQRYRQIAESYADTDLGRDAAKRADQLASPEAADFYKWFAEYKPPATPPTEPAGSEPELPPVPELPPEQTAPQDSETKPAAQDQDEQPGPKPPPQPAAKPDDRPAAKSQGQEQQPSPPGKQTKEAEDKAAGGGTASPQSPAARATNQSQQPEKR